MPFEQINRTMNKRAISATINLCYRKLGLKETVVFADQLMYTGFHYATRAGVSFGVNDMVVPSEKQAILDARRARGQGHPGPVRGGSRDRRRALQQGRRHLVAHQRPGRARR